MAIIGGNDDLSKKAPKERSPEDKARVEAMKARIEAQNAAKAAGAAPTREAGAHPAFDGKMPPPPPGGEMPAELVEKIAREVIAGKWDVGQKRVELLKAHGFDPDVIQKKVNELLK